MESFDELRSAFEAYLNQTTFDKEPTGLYDPVNYILTLGGKRIRPILLLAAYRLFGEDIQEAIPQAYSIELFHNFTLLHDDIMDNANLRRGHQTVHEKYNVNTAILSGDVMMMYAYKYMTQDVAEKLPLIIAEFNKASIEICEGQQDDMDFESRDDVAIPEYIKMIEYKTAVLLGAAMKIGAIIGGASQQDASHIYDFGKNLGIAFQIQDDILDTFGEKAKVGKVIGGDIMQSKKTYLFLKSLDLLEEDKKNEFLLLYNSDVGTVHDKVEQVKSVFEELHVRVYADQLKENYEQLAKSHLDAVQVSEQRKSTIKEIFDMVLARQA